MIREGARPWAVYDGVEYELLFNGCNNGRDDDLLATEPVREKLAGHPSRRPQRRGTSSWTC